MEVKRLKYICESALVKKSVLLLAVALLFASCRSTRYVKEGEHLLVKNEIQLNTKRIERSSLDVYIKQYPNKTSIFGIKWGLMMFNMSKDTADCKFFVNRWLRTKVGEPPVILDTTLIDPSKQSMAFYLRSLGYYDFEITDSVNYRKKKKATVIYTVNVESPIRIKSLKYEIEDPKVAELVFADTLSSTIFPGMLLAHTTLQTERERITKYLRNRGYYEFNSGYIKFRADTVENKANLTMQISKPDHKRFMVKDIYVYTNYDGLEAYKDSNYLSRFDTLQQADVYYLYKEKLGIRPTVIRRVNLIERGELYSETDVTQTYTNLSNLGIYRSITISFKERGGIREDSTDNVVPLACEILLTPSPPHGYNVGLEISTNSSGLWSIAPSIGYNHLNLFKGAELFNISVRGAYQRFIPTVGDYRSSKEFGIATSIKLPKFLAPIKPKFSRRNIPHTTFSGSFGYQQRPDFTRQIASGTFGYSWITRRQAGFTFNPIEIALVNMRDIDSSFLRRIESNPFLKNIYESHFIGGGSVIYTQKFSPKGQYDRKTHFVRVGLDLAGNIASLFNSMLTQGEDGSRQILGSRYAQYAKIDVNYSFNRRLTRTSNMVYHIYVGLGKPYGNSRSLPLEKMFFGGGANSLRGWQARTVGPGSAPKDTTSIVPNQVGDMTLEANLEYRFKLVSSLEGAVFLDVGNIWSLNPANPEPGSLFRYNTFYSQLAASPGIGVRLNLSFIVVRADMGFKLHDPVLEGNGFILPNKWLRSDNFSIHFALNYPF